MAWIGKSLSECTWEKQSTLPATLIADYENGVTFNVKDSISESVGQAVHTLLPTISPPTSSAISPPDAKKTKVSIPVVPQTNTGVFLDKADVLEILNCNTEKDRHVRLNHHTTGIQCNSKCSM